MDSEWHAGPSGRCNSQLHLEKRNDLEDCAGYSNLGSSSFSRNVPAVSQTKTKAKAKVILKAADRKTAAKSESAKFTVQ